MKINRLYLQNFRNHSQSEAILDRVNYFLGRNNAGKSSILAAIEWGLTGRCGWTDRAGRGAGDMLKHGEKSATVALDVDGLGPVLRTIGPSGLTVAGETRAQAAQVKLLNTLATDEEALSAVLNVGSFMSMPPGEQRNFLFTVFGLRWDIATVEDALRDWAKSMKYSDTVIEELAGRVRPLYPPRVTAGPEVLDIIEKKVREYRKETRRDLQRVTAAREEMIIEYPDGLSTADLPELEAQLAEVKAQRDRLLTRLADRKQAEDRRQALENDLRSTEYRLKQARDALAMFGPAPAAPPRYPDPTELKELALKAQEVSSKLAGLESLLNNIRQAIGALSNNDGRCPLAPDLVKCAMTANARTKLVEDLRGQAAKLAEQVKHSSEELKKIRSEQTARTEDYNNAMQEMNKAQEEAHQQARLETQAKELEKQAAKIRKDLKEFAGLDSPDLSPLQELDERLARGLKLSDTLKAATRKEQEMTGLDEDIKNLQQDLNTLEILVKAFSSEGIKKQVLAKIMQPFEERVNGRLNRLTDGCYQMRWTPDMAIEIFANGTPLPMRMLSTSEQVRVGIALQEAIAAFLGLRIIAIDGADVLDQENRDLLTGCLLDIMEAGEYDQALVFSTVGDVTPQNPGIPGLKMFWVEDGKVSEIA